MKIFLHQKNNNIGNLQNAIESIIQTYQQSDKVGLHLFPELFLGGYPLQDLCLQKPFISQYEKSLEQIRKVANSANDNNILFGGIEYELDKSSEIIHIYNCIYHLGPKGLTSVYQKQLLPNYDIYDEKKYFTAGEKNGLIEINDFRICLFICEDMWHSSTHKTDPVKKIFDELQTQNIALDAIINLSASPFHAGKQHTRLKRGQEISTSLNAPFFYVNQIGLNDEILFDGRSFILDGSTQLQADSFREEVLEYSCKKNNLATLPVDSKTPSEIENTWENLFRANIDKEDKRLTPISESELIEIIQAQTFALNEYAKKTKMKSFLIALSGGIDSALVVAIAHLASKASAIPVEAVYMPSQYNANISYELSKQLCDNIGINLKVINLKFIHQTIKMTFKDGIGEDLTGLADENIQSRLRGNLIYARSNQTGAMVINTSNKSELAVGYSTLYGDSVGAISLLGDLYKSEVYQLARFINTHFNNIIPEEIITRPPSAELREGQKDEDSLPPYDRLDLILECLLSYQFSLDEICQLGIKQDELNHVFNLYHLAEFKRFQFCPVVKLKSKSFGFGYRNPILKELRFDY